MRRVVADKIASVADSCGLTPELRLSDEIPCEEGVVLIELQSNKYIYNELELADGRMAKVPKRDVIVGALGQRKALIGYLDSVSVSVLLGDIVQQQLQVRAVVSL